jgi:hypothetical protein
MSGELADYEIAAALNEMKHLGFDDWEYNTGREIFFSKRQLRQSGEVFTPLHPDSARLVVGYAELQNANERLLSAATMAREELVFGGDWETAKAKLTGAILSDRPVAAATTVAELERLIADPPPNMVFLTDEQLREREKQ